MPLLIHKLDKIQGFISSIAISKPIDTCKILIRNMDGFFHECEIKYRLPTGRDQRRIEWQAKQLGFVCEGTQVETDFLPDTEDFLCRQNNLLLRFRRFRSGSDGDILLTLKVKGHATTFQEHFELEYKFSLINEKIFNQINDILRQATSRTLPITIHDFDANHFEQLIAEIKTVFPAHRILLEKQRTTYTRKDGHMLFDLLPEGIGHYLEIEASSPEKLKRIVDDLNLTGLYVEPLDNGNILKRHKQGLPDQEARTGIFGHLVTSQITPSNPPLPEK